MAPNESDNARNTDFIIRDEDGTITYIELKDGSEKCQIYTAAEWKQISSRMDLRNAVTVEASSSKISNLFFAVAEAIVFIVESFFRKRSSNAGPPSSALLSAFLPIAVSEDVIANLNVVFDEVWLPRHGTQTAKHIWRAQAVLIVMRYWGAPIVSFLERAKRFTTGT